jgi:hypothetical protein
MIAQDGVLVQLLRLVDRIPTPLPPRPRGRPVFYPERLFLKALVIMIVRRLHKGWASCSRYSRNLPPR